MKVRRPLVLDGGRRKELPQGDAVAGVPVSLPVRLVDNTTGYLSLDSQYQVPVLLVGGTTDYAPTVIA